MKGISLRWLGTLLRGLVNGEIKLYATSKGAAKPSGRSGKKVPKPGRRPLSEGAKRKKKEKAKAEKARQARRALPNPRDLFLFLVGKLDGMTLSQIARHFAVKRSLLGPLLGKLVKKGDLDALKGKYFLRRRVRLPEGQKAVDTKPQPVSPAAILAYLADNGPSTLAAMAKAMHEPSYHRLIRVANALKKSGQISTEGKVYRLSP